LRKETWAALIRKVWNHKYKIVFNLVGENNGGLIFLFYKIKNKIINRTKYIFIEVTVRLIYI